MIILAVPPQYTKDDIIEEFLKKYRAHRDEYHILTSQNSRKYPDTKNWIIVLPLDLGRAVVRGGLSLGIHHCQIRPHTSVQRCTTCQDYGHSYKNCGNNRFCMNCGDKHSEGPCDKRPGCANCKFNNDREGTNYNINHRANDPNCPIYRQVYDSERERLNDLFNIQQRRVQPPPPDHPARQESYPYDNHGGLAHHWDPYWQGHQTPMFGHWPHFNPEMGRGAIPYVNHSISNYPRQRPYNK